MADSNIGALPQAANLDDDSLLVAEQQGQAVKVTGVQFKEFGRQAVIGQVQGYVDQAEAAADRAVDAVSAVTDMTVEASTLASGQNATVTKTTKNGKVNLAFGLPRGEQGIPGPEGQTGPRGPQGPTGNGLTILGHYDTEAALRAAVTAPKVGDAYSIGTATPYDTYIFDGVTLDWKNYGPLSGGGGGVLPEDVVTAEGGASMSFPIDLGDGPHVITFTDEEEPPLTAEDIQYDSTQNVKQAIDGLKSYVSDGKTLIASAITDKGVDTAQDATFQQMADNIGQISGGSGTSDATATSFDILAPKTAYTATGKVEGTIPTLLGQTIVPGTADKTIANGQYLGGTQVIKGDPNLTSGNIKSGVTLFGVEGALESAFKATLTVTADTGAVVTATHTDGTEVSALSQTGTVVLELPKEGTWSVTAVRGVAQYNTVTIQVSSSYSAELTAEVHVEYYGPGAHLDSARFSMAATSVGIYAIFGGGMLKNGPADVVDVYSNTLTHSVISALSKGRGELSAASVGQWAIFLGGNTDDSDLVDVYNSSLSHGSGGYLPEAVSRLAAAEIGAYALFGGGRAGGTERNKVYTYNESLTKSSAEVLAIPSSDLAAASNQFYAIFAGGYGNGATLAHVTAYDQDLTKSTPVNLSAARMYLTAVRAGNYVLFAGGNPSNLVDAYDLFLTRTAVEPLGTARGSLASATLDDYAVLGGGYYLSGSSLKTTQAVDIYDPYLTHTTPEDMLQTSRQKLSAASISPYVIFAGGDVAALSPTNVVDVYHHV